MPRTLRSSGSPALAWFWSEYFVLVLAGVYLLALAPFTPGFTDSSNFLNLLSTLLPLFIVAVGQTVVLITGGIDLSVTSIMALCSISGAAVMNGDNGWLADHPLAVPAGIGTMLLVGASVGTLNGLAIWLTRSRNIGNLPAAFNQIGGSTWFALPLVTLLAVAAHGMLSRSLWGRWIYAVGQNPAAARISGVPVSGTAISAYVVSGLLAAVASVLYTGQAESASPILAQRLLLDIVGATVIGGTSLFGGKGKILWTLFGVLFLKLIDNSLNLLDLSYFSIMMVKGGVILLAALLDALRNRK